MARVLICGPIAIMAFAFLALCYQEFARADKELKMRGISVVHPFGNTTSSKASATTSRTLMYALLIATVLTASVYEQSNRQSVRQLEQQIQQLQQTITQLQLRVDALEKTDDAAGRGKRLGAYVDRKWPGQAPGGLESFQEELL